MRSSARSAQVFLAAVLGGLGGALLSGNWAFGTPGQGQPFQQLEQQVEQLQAQVGALESRFNTTNDPELPQLVLRATPGSDANIQEWLDGDGNLVAAVTATGDFVTNGHLVVSAPQLEEAAQTTLAQAEAYADALDENDIESIAGALGIVVSGTGDSRTIGIDAAVVQQRAQGACAAGTAVLPLARPVSLRDTEHEHGGRSGDPPREPDVRGQPGRGRRR